MPFSSERNPVTMRNAVFRSTLFLLALCSSSPLLSSEAPPWNESVSGQIILVVTDTWESPRGTLGCFEKRNRNWVPAGIIHDVTVGRKGLGLGVGWHDKRLKGPLKQEGDDRAPAGIFPLEFGFGARPLDPDR